MSQQLPIQSKCLDPTVSCVALLREEKVYVVDRGNNCIQVLLQKNEKFVTTFEKGNAPGQLNAPSDSVIDTKLGRILVSDPFWVDKISKFETVCEFCINPSHEGNLVNYRIYASHK